MLKSTDFLRLLLQKNTNRTQTKRLMLIAQRARI